MTPGFTVEVRAGRLVEARVRTLVTREDADAYGLAVATAAARTPGAPVLLADHRAVRIYPQPAADRLVELFRPNNTRYARIAVVVSPLNATLRMQLERLVREARPERMVAPLRDGIPTPAGDGGGANARQVPGYRHSAALLDHRRVCTEADSALEHLASSLDWSERERARAFLAELVTGA